ncbi:ABC transporter substrate-binding protein [Halobacteriales archaeon QH_10_67_13]|nr:MAG: ABC transporter substrate-binding protein [Halobacteriales archaeon QH_10_67_13]
MRQTSRILLVLMVLLAAGPALGGVAVANAPGQASAQLGDEVSCEFPVELEDADGETVVVEEEPERVVALQPNAAQHMWSIGAQEKVVGMPVNQFTAYLNGSENRTNVLNDEGFSDPETVVDLEPDLVLAPDIVPDETVETLRDANVTVYRYPLINSFEQMYATVEDVGLLVGEFEGAAETTASVAGTIQATEAAVEDEESPRVYYEFFQFTASPGTIDHEVITRAGGENIVQEGDFDRAYGQLSDELLVERDPEWLVLQEGAPIPDSEALQQTTAVQEDQIIRIDSNFISQHGPRTLEPLRTIAEALHPEAIESATVGQAEPVERSRCAIADGGQTDDGQTGDGESDDQTDTTDGETGDTATDDDADGVGFTAVGAVAALAVLGLLARRLQ